MGWWTGRSSKDDASKQALSKIFNLIQDERAQIAWLPGQLQQTMLQNGTRDTIVGASGEFGRSLSNPIPVNGPLGEIIYLSNLVTDKGKRISFHRLGSVGSIDAFEIVQIDGQGGWDLLYLNLYYERKSKLRPSGYSYDTREFEVRGSNATVTDFPNGIFASAQECAKQLLGGIPLVDRSLAQLDQRKIVWRDDAQRRRLAQWQTGSVQKSPVASAAEFVNRFARRFFIICDKIRNDILQQAKKYDIELTKQFDVEFIYLSLYICTTIISIKCSKQEYSLYTEKIEYEIFSIISNNNINYIEEMNLAFGERLWKYRRADCLFSEDESNNIDSLFVLSEFFLSKPGMIEVSALYPFFQALVPPLREAIMAG